MSQSAENDARQVWCVAYQDERGVYMDGPRSIRTSEFQTLRGAEDALDIIERRSGNDPKRDLRIETRFVTGWTRVIPPAKP